MELITYLDFAENDYLFFSAVVKEKMVYNAIGSLASSSCEKYFKHIIDCYVKPQTSEESARKDNVLVAHNLRRLLKYIDNNLSIDIPEQVRDAVNEINGYYYSTSYPGDSAMVLDSKDIDRAKDALDEIREFSIKLICELEKQAKNKLLPDFTNGLENSNKDNSSNSEAKDKDSEKME